MKLTTKNKIHKYIVSKLHADPEAFHHLFENNEINYTRLTEELAYDFLDAEADEALDDDTHWIWDVGIEEGDFIEQFVEDYILDHY